MSASETPAQFPPVMPGPTRVGPDALTPEQERDLADTQRQAEWRAAYEVQLRRRACPGCGEA